MLYSFVFSFHLYILLKEILFNLESSEQYIAADTDLWGWRSKKSETIENLDDNFNVTTVLLICLSLLLLYLCIKCYKQPKPKRRKPKLKRLLSIMQCNKVPAV